jgi:hypothetical protein
MLPFGIQMKGDPQIKSLNGRRTWCRGRIGVSPWNAANMTHTQPDQPLLASNRPEPGPFGPAARGQLRSAANLSAAIAALAVSGADAFSMRSLLAWANRLPSDMAQAADVRTRLACSASVS